MAAAKARDKGRNNQPSTGAAKARRRMMERSEDATTSHLWQRRASAGNESKRTMACNGQKKWAVAVDNRVDDCTTTAGPNKNRWQQHSRRRATYNTTTNHWSEEEMRIEQEEEPKPEEEEEKAR
jgi:hypothetical protein